MFSIHWTWKLWCEIKTTVQHTSASLTINENYDSDVREDTETFLNRIVPEVSFFLSPIWCIHYYCSLVSQHVLISSFRVLMSRAGVICAMEAYSRGLVLGDFSICVIVFFNFWIKWSWSSFNNVILFLTHYYTLIYSPESLCDSMNFIVHS